MKIHLTMHYFKECQHSHRYQGEKGDVIHSLYIRNEAIKKGEKAPHTISVTVHGLD